MDHDTRGEIDRLTQVTYEHHWRLRTLESHLWLTRKRLAQAEARAALMDSGRDARSPGLTCRSQYGEDALIWELTDGRCDGRYVEAGAVDGLTLSVSAFFEALGWSGVLIEPVPEEAAACRASRPASTVIEAALAGPRHPAVSTFTHVRGAAAYSGMQPDEAHLNLARQQGGVAAPIEVSVTTLDDALEAAGAGSWSAIDVVVLDLEGGEAEALEGFDLSRWRPRLMLIEDHEAGDDSTIARVMKSHDYVQVGTLRVNRVYVHSGEDDMIARAADVPGFC